MKAGGDMAGILPNGQKNYFERLQEMVKQEKMTLKTAVGQMNIRYQGYACIMPAGKSETRP
jgi:hypothetical protein